MLNEENQADLTPQLGRHDDDDLGAGSVAKTECPTDDLVKLIARMQLYAVDGVKKTAFSTRRSRYCSGGGNIIT